MAAALTRIVRLTAPLRPALGRRPFVSFKPPKEELGPGAMLIGFSTLSVTILAPAAWFLAHIESFKQRE